MRSHCEGVAGPGLGVHGRQRLVEPASSFLLPAKLSARVGPFDTGRKPQDPKLSRTPSVTFVAPMQRSPDARFVATRQPLARQRP
jgi:hypothetical protein